MCGKTPANNAFGSAWSSASAASTGAASTGATQPPTNPVISATGLVAASAGGNGLFRTSTPDSLFGQPLTNPSSSVPCNLFSTQPAASSSFFASTPFGQPQPVPAASSSSLFSRPPQLQGLFGQAQPNSTLSTSFAGFGQQSSAGTASSNFGIFGHNQPSNSTAVTSGTFGPTSSLFGSTAQPGLFSFASPSGQRPSAGCGTSSFGQPQSHPGVFASSFGQPQSDLFASRPSGVLDNPFGLPVPSNTSTDLLGFPSTSTSFGAVSVASSAPCGPSRSMFTFDSPRAANPFTGLFGSGSSNQVTVRQEPHGSFFGPNNAASNAFASFGQHQNQPSFVPTFDPPTRNHALPSSSMFANWGSTTSSTSAGTTIKFLPRFNTDVVNKDGAQKNIITQDRCICTMKEYDEKKSMEELRLDDYMASRKVDTLSSTTPSIFARPDTSGTRGGLFATSDGLGLFGSIENGKTSFQRMYPQLVKSGIDDMLAKSSRQDVLVTADGRTATAQYVVTGDPRYPVLVVLSSDSVNELALNGSPKSMTITRLLDKSTFNVVEKQPAAASDFGNIYNDIKVYELEKKVDQLEKILRELLKPAADGYEASKSILVASALDRLAEKLEGDSGQESTRTDQKPEDSSDNKLDTLIDKPGSETVEEFPASTDTFDLLEDAEVKSKGSPATIQSTVDQDPAQAAENAKVAQRNHRYETVLEMVMAQAKRRNIEQNMESHKDSHAEKQTVSKDFPFSASVDTESSCTHTRPAPSFAAQAAGLLAHSVDSDEEQSIRGSCPANLNPLFDKLVTKRPRSYPLQAFQLTGLPLFMKSEDLLRYVESLGIKVMVVQLLPHLPGARLGEIGATVVTSAEYTDLMMNPLHWPENVVVKVNGKSSK